MSADHPKQPITRPPVAGAGLALMLTMALLWPLDRGVMAANKPATGLKPPVQSAATGDLKTSRQALLKQRTNVFGLTSRHPGKIVGATGRPPKMIVTKRFLPK